MKRLALLTTAAGLVLGHFDERLEVLPAGAVDLAQTSSEPERAVPLLHRRDSVGLPAGEARGIGDVGEDGGEGRSISVSIVKSIIVPSFP